MKLLEERILKDGVAVDEDVLKVDRFLNHQMDVELFNEMGKEWYRLFGGGGVNKILTIEASGIGMACIAAQYFHCPVVFAKEQNPQPDWGGLCYGGGVLHPWQHQSGGGVQAISESGGPGAAH